jgi:protein-disulfide isomerase
MSHRLLAAFALLFAIMLPAAAFAQPAGPDWSRSVTITPAGGFLVGSPTARTQLVEYFSYTCPHCADFAKEAGPTLQAMVKSGQLSVEYRNYIRDGFDLTAALLARCGGQGKFLASHEAIFAGYDQWIGKVEAYAKNPPPAPEGEDRSAQFIDIADKTGLTALAAKQGIAGNAAHACLANKNSLATILAITAGAWDADPRFEGTPGFLIDGKPVSGVHSWAGLKPQLPGAAAVKLAPAKAAPAKAASSK